MNIVVLTSVRTGSASFCLPALVHACGVRVVGVIWCTGVGVNRQKARKRKIRKIVRIGILGALNGLRMRKWYQLESDPIENVCERLRVPLYTVDRMNDDATAEILKRLSPDLGVSLGNGYLAPQIFEVPVYGMINVHTEQLPQFQGAQGIIWPLYFGLKDTGFTIHQIDHHIDTGRILYRKQIPIQFMRHIGDTVRVTNRRVWAEVPDQLVYVVQHFHQLFQNGTAQGKGQSYTTPSMSAFIRMWWMHHLLKRRFTPSGTLR